MWICILCSLDLYISHLIKIIWGDESTLIWLQLRMMKAKEPSRKQYLWWENSTSEWNNKWKSYCQTQKKDSWKVQLLYLYQKVNWWHASQEPTYHNILRERVSAEGAIIKHDLVEGLRCHSDHSAAVVPGVPVLCDDGLPHRDAPLARLQLLMRGGGRKEKRKRKKRKGQKQKKYLKNKQTDSNWLSNIIFNFLTFYWGISQI